jgi:transcriptional regulator with GAF, ATPase, and Fis domain
MDTPLRVLLVGAGRVGTSFLHYFAGNPAVRLVGVVDIDPAAPGLASARDAGIPVAATFHDLLRTPDLQLVIDVTGDSAVYQQLRREREDVEVISTGGAHLFWWLLHEYQHKEVLQQRYELVLQQLEQKAGDFVIGGDPRMRDIAELVLRVAPAPTTVLITGETGTGKEVVARAIHRHSQRRDRPLVTVNCTALSAGLIESELFGHVRGAFTGATTDRRGLLEAADGGTVFLDEIGDMPLEMQSKLLRFLQEGEVRRVGEQRTRKVDVRVIAATNQNLHTAVENGLFRADLYYRLNAIVMDVPPLRQRRADIPLLAYHFLRRAQAKVNKRVTAISSTALWLLYQYEWPGNLRELANVIERAVVLTDSNEIGVAQLPLGLRPNGDVPPQPEADLPVVRAHLVDDFDRNALVRHLAEASGNVTRAAKAAGVSRRTFHRLLNKHGLSATSFRT